jgi:histidinol-phosphatase (PHP family)
MLTDLHVHLRPDEPGTSAQNYFTTENVERYTRAAGRLGIGFLGVSEHIYRFRQALSVWRHPFWEAQAVDDLDAYCDFVRTRTSLALGIEADYVPGREQEISDLLEGYDFDYVIGSVHFLGWRAVDMDGQWDVWRAMDAETIWHRYFQMLGDASASGLFDIIAHPDLVKVWGGQTKPTSDLRRFYEPAVERMAQSDVAIEVSTAGLRKPVAEIYPEPELLDLLLGARLPVALSSDAHVPEHLGHRYPEAIELLQSRGVSKLATYRGRRRQLEPLG